MTNDNKTPSIVSRENNAASSNPMKMVGSLILAGDVIFAAIIWFFRNDIFAGMDNAGMIAGIVAASMVAGGIIAFFVLKNLSVKR